MSELQFIIFASSAVGFLVGWFASLLFDRMFGGFDDE